MASDRSVERRIPRDAAVVINVLRSMGVEEWEPRVVNQLMEFVHRYAAEVLEESRAYAAHAERASVSLDDVKLAIAAKLETQFVPPTSAEDMKAYADAVNAAALPALTNRPGIHVAQEENLLSPNYQFFPRAGAAGTRGDGDGDGDGDLMAGGDAKRPVPAAAKPRAEPTAMEAHEPVKVAVRGSKRKK